jgi:hypothetical protein
MRLRQAGLQVQDVEIRRPDLEDVFLQVMHQHSTKLQEISA